MKTLILMMGLPYSGKTTDARTLGAPIVSRDDIRMALHGERFLPRAENMVSVIEDVMVGALLPNHDVVIIDGCHQTAARRERWVKYADRSFYEAEVKVWEVPTTLSVCLSRALLASDDDIIPIINDMSDRYQSIDSEYNEQLSRFGLE